MTEFEQAVLKTIRDNPEVVVEVLREKLRVEVLVRPDTNDWQDNDQTVEVTLMLDGNPISNDCGVLSIPRKAVVG